MADQKNNLYVDNIAIVGKKAAPAPDNVKLYGVVLAWGCAAFYIFVMQVIVPGYREGFELFGQILTRSAPSPYAYRVLVPVLIKALAAPLSGRLEPQSAFLAGYCVYCFAAIEFSTVTLFRMLRLWFDEISALLGILMFCFMFAVAARHEHFQPWSLVETGFYAGAIIWGVRGSGGWAVMLTVAAALNRETGLFVPLLFCATLPGDWFDRKRNVYLAALVGVWLVVFYGLRLIIGPRPSIETLAECLHANLLPISIALTLAASAAFFSISLPAALGWQRIPQQIRRCTVVLLLYIPLMFLYGRWWEVRHWLPLSCILLPFAISGVQIIIAGPGRSLGLPGDWER